MKILLTGSTGMVGRNIFDHPDSTVYEFICPSRNELNLLKYDEVDKALKEYKPEMIIHAAGKVGGIKANVENPIKFLTDNVQMGINIILSAYENRVSKLINLGSSCMYPREAMNPLEENSILSGQLEPTNEGYALAKIVAQRLCNYIYKERPTLNYKTLIPCNLYGKYDDFSSGQSHLIPAIIRKVDEAIKSNTNIEIWGDGKARREFMYAGDLANVIYFSIDNYSFLDNTMNIGLGYDFSVNEYYEKIAKLMNYNGGFVHNLDMPAGITQKLVSVVKQKKIGWEPTYELEEGLKKTIDYYYKEVK